MKNARKLNGQVAGLDTTQINPGPIVPDQADCQPLFENAIFHEKPKPRQPEPQEEENFRSFLKTSMPRYKASAALIERIRTIPDDHKE